MSTDDDAAAVLASVVPLGDTPTPQAQGLADAVARHVANRPTILGTTNPRTLGERLCQMWGLDADKVGHITIDIAPDGPPAVTVQMYADDHLGFVLVPYRLEEA